MQAETRFPDESGQMKNLAENLWLLRYSLPILGEYLGRNVTVIRLRSGELVIHSTGPFSPEDVAAISAVGTPAFLVEAITLHDTFAKEGRAAFPNIPYLAPEGFSETVGFPTEPLSQLPAAWQGELDSLELAGKSKAPEYVFFHRPSRTLIVTDLAFNVEDDAPLGVRLLSYVQVGSQHSPGMPRPEKFMIGDRAAFLRSVEKMMSWDFDRVIVGHGEPIETGGKGRMEEEFRAAGF